VKFTSPLQREREAGVTPCGVALNKENPDDSALKRSRESNYVMGHRPTVSQMPAASTRPCAAAAALCRLISQRVSPSPAKPACTSQAALKEPFYRRRPEDPPPRAVHPARRRRGSIALSCCRGGRGRAGQTGRPQRCKRRQEQALLHHGDQPVPMPPVPRPAPDAAHLLVRSEQMAALEAALFASGLPVAALMEKGGPADQRRLLAQPAAGAAGVPRVVGPGHKRATGWLVARENCTWRRRRADSVPLRAPEHPWPQNTARSCLLVGDPGPDASPDPVDAGPLDRCPVRIWPTPACRLRISSSCSPQRRPPSRPAGGIRRAPYRSSAPMGPVLGAWRPASSQDVWSGIAQAGPGADKRRWPGCAPLSDADSGPAAALAGGPASRSALGSGAADLKTAPQACSAAWAAKYGPGPVAGVAGSDRYRGRFASGLFGCQRQRCGSLRAALPAGRGGRFSGAVQPQVVMGAAPEKDHRWTGPELRWLYRVVLDPPRCLFARRASAWIGDRRPETACADETCLQPCMDFPGLVWCSMPMPQPARWRSGGTAGTPGCSMSAGDRTG